MIFNVPNFKQRISQLLFSFGIDNFSYERPALYFCRWVLISYEKRASIEQARNALVECVRNERGYKAARMLRSIGGGLESEGISPLKLRRANGNLGALV